MLLRLLQNGKKYSINELSNIIEVSPRMIREYKSELELAGIYIESIRGRYGGYYLNQDIKLSDNMDKSKSIPIDNKEYFNLISKSINNRNKCYIEYYSKEHDKMTKRVIRPYEIIVLDNEWGGYLYSSLEEAFQTARFIGSDDELVEMIKHSHSAHQAQKIAYLNIDKQRDDWEIKQLDIMEELLRLKVEQNPYVLKKLLETKDYYIVKDSPKDNFWGWGENRDGDNHLGKLWMKLREEYRNNY